MTELEDRDTLNEQYAEEMIMLNDEWEQNLKIQRAILIDKACAWLKAYLPQRFLSHETLNEFRRFMDNGSLIKQQ